GRLLLISPFDDKITTTTKDRAAIRNDFVAALSDVVLVPHASPGGKAEALARQVLQRQQPFFTFEDEENASLLKLGAFPYNLATICQEFLPSSQHQNQL
ncbi:MAG TPA: hypothetical protein VK137_03110, partial [Planctomycetaceae bacterium]|nr:hypothetical protein [Planctomycetaceae bacterium]